MYKHQNISSTLFFSLTSFIQFFLLDLDQSNIVTRVTSLFVNQSSYQMSENQRFSLTCVAYALKTS